MSARRPARQLIVAVILGVLVGGGLMAVTPAGASVNQAVATNWKKVWKKELKPLAAKAFYTKAQTDAKYATKAEAAAAAAAAQSAATTAATSAAGSATDAKLNGYYKKAESDARYQPVHALQRGQWSLGAAPIGGQPVGAISFPEPVAAKPTIAIVDFGAPATTNCPGTAAAPDARPGYLCIYVAGSKRQTGFYGFNPQVFGTQISADAISDSPGYSDNYAYGSWAVR